MIESLEGKQVSTLERAFFLDNLLVRIHFIIVMIRWTGLAPWEFEFTFPGSLIFTFLVSLHLRRVDRHDQVPRGQAGFNPTPYRGTSLIRNRPPL